MFAAVGEQQFQAQLGDRRIRAGPLKEANHTLGRSPQSLRLFHYSYLSISYVHFWFFVSAYKNQENLKRWLLLKPRRTRGKGRTPTAFWLPWTTPELGEPLTNQEHLSF